MESPIPILPLPTPDAETEKLIRMKDEEVSRAAGKEQGLVEVGGLGLLIRPLLSRFSHHLPLFWPHLQLRRMQEMLQKMKQQMQDQ